MGTKWSGRRPRKFDPAAREVISLPFTIWSLTKASRDLDFAAKIARILALHDQPPAHGRVICVDEFGPLNLQPRPAGRLSDMGLRDIGLRRPNHR